MGHVWTDLELWESICAGDEKAFRVLFDRYNPDLFRYGHHFTEDRDLLKDCLQEVWVGLWRKAEKKQALDHPAAYLFTSTRRMVLKRNEQRQRRLTVVPPLPEQASAEELRIAAEEEEASNGRLRQELHLLPHRQREAIFLRYFQDMDYGQIAAIMDVSRQVAYNYVARGLHGLRQQLNGAREVFLSFFPFVLLFIANG